jgi:hypothetical protein
LEVDIGELGDYQFVVKVDGVESEPSGIITVDRNLSLADPIIINILVAVLIAILSCVALGINHLPKSFIYANAMLSTTFYSTRMRLTGIGTELNTFDRR